MGAVVAALDYDAELMLRVKEGDGASFGLLLEKYRSPVIHFLYRMVQNHAVSEELAQEVFLAGLPVAQLPTSRRRNLQPGCFASPLTWR